MSDADATPAAATKPRRTFTPRSTKPKPSPDQARRQGAIANEAWQALGGRDAVMAFLNAHHAELDGRPLDLAIESDAGLDRVRGALASHVAAPNAATEEQA